RFQPPLARIELALRGGLVEPALAARLPFEMLDRIGDVRGRGIDPRFAQESPQQLAGGADEGTADEVFLVARLLAHQQNGGVSAAFARDALRRPLPQGAAATVIELLLARPGKR